MEVSAGTAFIEALGGDVDRLLAAEPEVQADADDSVHQMRVATRRLRSVLRSYRMLLRRDRAEEVGRELKWLAGLLGVARDAEVRGDRFAALLAEHTDAATEVAEIDTVTGKPAEDGNGHRVAAPLARPSDIEEITARLVTAERARYAGAHAQILAALAGERYHRLRDTLVDWKSAPPLRPARAAVPAPEFFRVVLQRDHERIEAFIRAEPSTAPDDRIETLHDIRKSAKRLRYSCEAAGEVLGAAATDLGKAAKHLQSVLGDHRDAIESRAVILERAAEAEAVGGNSGLYHRLADIEQQAADHELEGYPDAARALTSHAPQPAGS
ncbi:CHAD domain-containing protein [Nocardia sp. NPDC048505]|uniref:CHAD domain-containing protein n=1 Tax=unclassified Nocardia TaxID=2637762 RepID=UPI0033E539F3